MGDLAEIVSENDQEFWTAFPEIPVEARALGKPVIAPPGSYDPKTFRYNFIGVPVPKEATAFKILSVGTTEVKVQFYEHAELE